MLLNVRSLSVILALLLTACGPQAPETIPTGTYTLGEITGSGTNMMTLILDQGHFKITTSDFGDLTEGSYTQTGKRVTFTEEKLSPRAKSFCGTKTVYTYEWAYNPGSDELKFAVVEDACSVRAGTNTGQVWKKKT